ncbi:MAG TPA: methyl-accepting chemotaxis protein [Candidatus Eisenbacteria bacterium]|nr:methyl-accepting chemotaxis protein [Candidatus Eisenbacteria bacterium]
MTDAERGHQNDPNTLRPPSIASAPAAPIFIVSLVATLGAAGVVYGLGDLIGLVVAVVIGIAGAAVAAFAAGKPPAPPEAKASALLEAASAEDAKPEPPSRFRGEPWASLYRRAAGYIEAQRSATLAVQEVERLRNELEQKSASPDSFEPRPSHAEHELVGGGAASEGSDVAGPVETSGTADRVREAVEEAVAPIGQGLAAIESELAPLLRSLQVAGTNSEGAPNGHPAKMVDALVRTAADGIEDLAAGLMRANELAIVAERVTNRATLLALNAALEATRSGSEAFASIAEETRRLAEYAREATDTISRLSSEIEMKVGETIGSIQSSSEDAKAAVDSIRTGVASSRAVAPETVQALESLLGRVRALRARAEGVAASPAAAAAASPVPSPEPVPPYSLPAAGDSPTLQDSEPAPSFVTLDASAPSEPLETQGAESAPAWGDVTPAAIPTPDSAGSHDTFGSRSIDEPGAPTEAEGASTEESDAAPSAPPSAEPPVSSSGPQVVPKIPDWLEGIGPRDHR